MVTGALLIAHPNVDKASEAFRQMASQASTNTLLHGTATGTPGIAQAAHSDRIAFWSRFFRRWKEVTRGGYLRMPRQQRGGAAQQVAPRSAGYGGSTSVKEARLAVSWLSSDGGPVPV